MNEKAGSPDAQIKTDEGLRASLDRISFRNSVIDFHWQFKFRRAKIDNGQELILSIAAMTHNKRRECTSE